MLDPSSTPGRCEEAEYCWAQTADMQLDSFLHHHPDLALMREKAIAMIELAALDMIKPLWIPPHYSMEEIMEPSSQTRENLDFYKLNRRNLLSAVAWATGPWGDVHRNYGVTLPDCCRILEITAALIVGDEVQFDPAIVGSRIVFSPSLVVAQLRPSARVRDSEEWGSEGFAPDRYWPDYLAGAGLYDGNCTVDRVLPVLGRHLHLLEARDVMLRKSLHQQHIHQRRLERADLRSTAIGASKRRARTLSVSIEVEIETSL